MMKRKIKSICLRAYVLYSKYFLWFISKAHDVLRPKESSNHNVCFSTKSNTTFLYVSEIGMPVSP